MTRIFKLICLISIVGGAPLLGMVLTGLPLSPYLAFPPTTEPIDSNTFSWLIFGILSLFMAATLFPFFLRFLDFSTLEGKTLSGRGFPSWGWAGLGVLLFSWVLAWSRFSWFQAGQNHTFTPLWIGYIMVINALTVKRTGHSPLTDQPLFYLSLFPLSAGFWWIFEFLNRFVHNWYYLGSLELDATTYFWVATLPFSTVLPAIVGTNEYLRTFPRLSRPFQGWRKMPIPRVKAVGWVNIIVASSGLVGIGLWPNLLFPLLWLSPLLILVGLQEIFGEKSVLEDLRQGDWTPIVLPALAGLICGFFWEMWNFYSLAHWKYTIPHVHGLQLFEMPLLGYFGYLPFGITCIALIQFLIGESLNPKLSLPRRYWEQFLRVQSSRVKVQG